MSKWERFKLLDKKDRIAVVVSLLYLVGVLVAMAAFANGFEDAMAGLGVYLSPLVLYWGYKAITAKPSTAAQPSKAASQTSTLNSRNSETSRTVGY